MLPFNHDQKTICHYLEKGGWKHAARGDRARGGDRIQRAGTARGNKKGLWGLKSLAQGRGRNKKAGTGGGAGKPVLLKKSHPGKVTGKITKVPSTSWGRPDDSGRNGGAKEDKAALDG